MQDYKYIVEIIKENKIPKGHLQIIQEMKINNKLKIITRDYYFNITNVLCDLATFKYNYNIEDEDIVYAGYDEETAFEKTIKIDKHENVYYYALAEFIKKLIIENKEISVKELEKIKLFFDIKTNYSISYKEKDKLYKKIGKDISEFTYKPLQYGFSKINAIFENDNKIPHRYIYNCSNLTDVLYSILHYLVLHNYTKIRKCNHCGKLYYYNHSNQRYCNRKSPYEDYTHLECEQAVRNIKQRLSDRNKSIQSHLTYYYEHNFNKYLNHWYELKDKVDLCSSVENLKKLDEFVKPKNIKKNFYIEQSIEEQLKG